MRKRTLAIVAVMTATFVLAVTAVAWPDDTIEYDYMGSHGPVDLGVLSPGSSTGGAFNLELNCNGMNHAAYGPLAFTVAIATESGVPATGELSVTPSLVVPETWPADRTGCPTPNDIAVTGSIGFEVSIPDDAPPGPRAHQVTLTPRDDHVKNGKDPILIRYCVSTCTPPTHVNRSPSVEAGGLYFGDEGADISIDGASASDPDPGDGIAAYSWTKDESGFPAADACVLADASTPTPTLTCGDNGVVTLTLTVTDMSGATSSDTATVTVGNLPPTITGATLSVNSFTGAASAGASFTDPGWLDTHTATLQWSIDPSPRTGSVTEENDQPDSTGTATDARTLAPGCYTVGITVRVTDDDGAFDEEVVASQQVDVYSARFLPPIRDNERNLVRYGNVVPVKVAITSSCTGASITTESLFIRTVVGDVGGTDGGTEWVTESASSADTGSQMRVSDGFHIYNYATRNLTAGQDYTLQIRLGSTTGPVLITAVLHPTR